jgi:shikimate dehydrogenase
MTETPFTAVPELLAVIGNPVAHSLSPAMHTAAIRALRLNYLYIACHVRPGGLRRFVDEVRRSKRLAGFNVTLPYKEKIIPLLSGISPLAKAVGAVNTVYWKGGKLWGTNTDVDGFAQSLKDLGVPLRKRAACVFGAGGASRAVLFALGRLGFETVAVINRTERRGARLSAEMQDHFSACTFSAFAWEDAVLKELFPRMNFFINTTSIGLEGEAYPPLPFEKARPDSVACDILYTPHNTSFLACARANGLRVQNGVKMFVAQGALAFRLWTGRTAPNGVMEAVVRKYGEGGEV